MVSALLNQFIPKAGHPLITEVLRSVTHTEPVTRGTIGIWRVLQM